MTSHIHLPFILLALLEISLLLLHVLDPIAYATLTFSQHATISFLDVVEPGDFIPFSLHVSFRH